MDLATSFNLACSAHNVPKDVEEMGFTTLCEKYSEPWRQYHTLSHIQQLLRLFSEHNTLVHDLSCCLFSIWFHDVIYEPTSKMNEEMSAIYWNTFCEVANIPKPFAAKVALFINATKTHKIDGLAVFGADLADLKLFLDMDVSILASSPQEYEEYVKGVRFEYKHVTDEAWKVGRPAVLRGLLSGSGLFLSPQFQHLEEVARANINREIDSIEKGHN